MTSESLGRPCYITLIENMAHSMHVDDMTHDKTQSDDVRTFVLVVVCMSSYSFARWWMSSWCIKASPLHGKMRGVFDSHWVRLMLHSHIGPFLYVGMLDKFVCSLKAYVRPFVRPWTHLHMLLHPSIHEQIFTWLSICEQNSLHASFSHLFTNMSFCMHSPCSSHPLPHHVCSCTCICSHSWWDDIKSINLLVYHDAWLFWRQVTKREENLLKPRKASFKLGCGPCALLVKTTQKSLREGDGKYRSTVIVPGISLGWRKNLRNFWEEKFGVQEGWAGKNCVIFGRCRQWEFGKKKLCSSWRELAASSQSLATKTT